MVQIKPFPCDVSVYISKENPSHPEESSSCRVTVHEKLLLLPALEALVRLCPTTSLGSPKAAADWCCLELLGKSQRVF